MFCTKHLQRLLQSLRETSMSDEIGLTRSEWMISVQRKYKSCQRGESNFIGSFIIFCCHDLYKLEAEPQVLELHCGVQVRVHGKQIQSSFESMHQKSKTCFGCLAQGHFHKITGYQP